MKENTMYIQYIAIIAAVVLFAGFFFYFMKRGHTLDEARKDPNKRVSSEYDAIGRSIIKDKNGRESRV
jgi:hypothetical protein